MKIIFVGQKLYFHSTYSDLLVPGETGIEAVEVPYTFKVTDPETLRDLRADVIFAFRGDLIPGEIVETWKGLKVFISTEPIPRLLADGQVEISNDRSQRMWELKSGTAKYDRLYHYDRTSRTYLERFGVKVDGEFILPISRLSRPLIEAAPTWDVLFYGRETSHRAQMTSTLKHVMGERYLQIAHGLIPSELERLAAMTAVGLNIHVDTLTQMEPRLQQMMALGLCVFSEPLSHNDLFRPGVHYVEAQNAQDLWGKLVYYLNSPDEMRRIAQAGRELVKHKLDALTEWKRLSEMLLAGKTYLPPTSERKRH